MILEEQTLFRLYLNNELLNIDFVIYLQMMEDQQLFVIMLSKVKKANNELI